MDIGDFWQVPEGANNDVGLDLRKHLRRCSRVEDSGKVSVAAGSGVREGPISSSNIGTLGRFVTSFAKCLLSNRDIYIDKIHR